MSAFLSVAAGAAIAFGVNALDAWLEHRRLRRERDRKAPLRTWLGG